MWWAGSRPIHVYLGESSAAVSLPGQEPLWSGHASAEQGWRWAVESARASTKKVRVRDMHVWLSGALARPFMLAPVPGIRSEGEACKIASSMANDATGLAGPCSVHLDRWDGRGPTLATAVGADLHELLLGKTAPLGLPRSVRPWWSVAVNRLVERDASAASIAVREADAMTVLGGVGESLTLASSLAATSTAEASSLLARLGVSAALDGEAWIVARGGMETSTDAARCEGLADVPFGAIAERCS